MNVTLVMWMAFIVGALIVAVVAETFISAAAEGLRQQQPPPEGPGLTAPARRPPSSRPG
jgi:hypothetical protein